MTNARVPRWFSIGDINAFFGLMLDNVVNLAVLAGILVGGFGFPADIVFTTRTDCQVYTPVIGSFGTFATVNGMQIGRAGATVAPLPNGGALIAGGFELQINPTTQTFGFVPTATADLFSSAPNLIAPTGSMAAARVFPLSVNLPDGTVMVLGGGVPAEIYQR